MKTHIVVKWILTIYTLIHEVSSTCSHLYGAEPCSFIPAPPGETPGCARPGLTYCEHPEHYPTQLIQYLFQQWRFDHSSILSDESKDDFASYFPSTPQPVYGPPALQKQNFYSPEPIYIPKPSYPFQLKPPINFTSNFYSGQQNLPFRYTNNIPPFQRNFRHNYDNALWKREVELKYQKLKRSLRYKRSLNYEKVSFVHSNGTVSHIRRRRQNNLSGETLCSTRSQYIMPRAALNNKGNWMYIVNMPELDNRYSQLVKSETCRSQSCNPICGLPIGYSSKCEQKFVQKRLVALEGGGNQLYTDVFWFPSCCVCTFSNN